MSASDEGSLRVYASFERRRGGLLYVLQLGLAATMYNVVTALGPGLASLAVNWGLYLLYFTLRWPLWRWLYRREGHLEERTALAEARGYVRFLLWFAPLFSLSLWVSRPASLALPLLAALLTVIGWVAVLVRFGRVPVDVMMLAAGFHTSGILSRPTTGQGLTLWMVVAALVTLGLWEHAVFVRARRRLAGPG
ncbi:MAG: hypothetical protein RDU89_05200 [bacterium]|nr:hypothetical protein [bacterium]